MNEQTFKTLEYDKIKALLRDCAVSGLGKRLVDELRPATEARAIEQMLRETTETRAILEAAGHIPLHGLSDVTEHMERVSRGAVLEPAALLALADLLRGCRKIKQFMARFREIAPQVSAYAGSITDLPELEEEIELSIENNRVSSAASPRLAKVRARMEIVNGRIKDKMNSFLTTPRYRECLQEPLISLKDGRYCLPVKASRRQEIAGTVLSSSGSGQTVFLEPAAVRELTNELKVLAGEEEAEQYQVLACLTGGVAAHFAAIQLNIETMAAYDFACAKAKFSRILGGIAPGLADGRRITIRRGRHPLLGREAVPLDFRIGDGYRVLLITGPNTGGKTVVLKTVGLFVLMAQSGLHVPAERGTVIGLFDQVLVDIGDRQSIEQSLSTFSGHMKNVVEILAAAGSRSLALLDEIGTGTDPAEGAALGAAVLADLYAAGAIVLATTHYGDLKRFSQEHEGFRNGCMEFDRETLQPLYRLVIGRAGRSNGLWIAERLGMRPETLAKAREIMTLAGQAGEVLEAAEEDGEPFLDFGAADQAGQEVSLAEPSVRTDAGTAETPERPFRIGDSVYVGTLKEKGLLCTLADARGDVVVLVRGKRIKVNQKRIKLHLPMEQLYPDPENYDLRIVLMSWEDRRLDNQMSKHHVEGRVRVIEEGEKSRIE